MAYVDPVLLARTRVLENEFGRAIANLASGPTLDLRIFFSIAHGYITGRIARHIELFLKPNALMRLNDSFATTYLNALRGSAHNDWTRAFKVCKAESDAVMSGFIGLIFIGPVAAEACGACMANVHIKRDLRDALVKVKDVDPQDYGNILTFVQEGNLYAETQLRGRALGSAAVMVGTLFVQRLNLDVKKWRNSVFQDCYGKAVPNPSREFLDAYGKQRGR